MFCLIIPADAMATIEQQETSAERLECIDLAPLCYYCILMRTLFHPICRLAK